MSSYYGLTIKVSDLNPLRFAQDNRIDTNYHQSMFRDTLFTTTANKMKYIQKYRIGDKIRIQVCTYGRITERNYHFVVHAKIKGLDGVVLSEYDFAVKTGTWSNGDLTVYVVICFYFVSLKSFTTATTSTTGLVALL